MYIENDKIRIQTNFMIRNKSNKYVERINSHIDDMIQFKANVGAVMNSTSRLNDQYVFFCEN